MATFFNEWCKDMSTVNLGNYKLSNDVIFWKLHHIGIVMSNCHNPNTRSPDHGYSSFKRHPLSSFNWKIL